MTDETLNRAASSGHAVVNAVAGSANEAVSKAKPAIDKVAAMAHQAVDRAAGAAAPTADWLNEKGESINATQKQLVADSRSYVSANPLTAVGFAVVAGFLLGRFIRR
jgi:ElaB/YqjD/DUF883 family membrane-anchored ribosome-binding protein